MSVEHGEIKRDSSEYAEILAEVFVEAVHKAASEAMVCEHCGDQITRSLMECLQYVYLHGPSSIREISSGLEVTLSAGSQLVDRLVKKDLVTRTETQEDRRFTCIELTDAGRQVVEDMRKRRSKWFTAIIDSLPKYQRCAFLEGLESFIKASLEDSQNIDRACVKCGMEHVSFCVINKLKSQRDNRPQQG